MSLALTAYRYATIALAPAVPFVLAQRARRGKEDALRIRERLGYASAVRPAGEVIWIHGASVGECLSVLPLMGALLEVPNRSVLVTSGTVSSANLIAERLPQRAVHQYVPVDTPAATGRFLDHWRPDMALFVDSEIWPNTIVSAHARNIPVALINGRMSQRAFAGWRRLRKAAATLLSYYDVCLVQDSVTADRLTALGAKRVVISGNLKADAPPLPVDQHSLSGLRDAIGNRPVLLAASTHAGEEETILPAHDRLCKTFPDLLTIVAPRHPCRGSDIAMLSGVRSTACRSRGELPTNDTAVYVADTLGELGTLYSLALFTFVGGSLVRHGGQNPLEPARLERGVLAGPYTQNFATAYDAIFAAQGAGRVASSVEIAAIAERLLRSPNDAIEMGKAAAKAAQTLAGAVDRTLTAVETLLSDAHA
ncbi:MAG: 3-deoxy-D-manno-octulosonic acid transferase [Alphaproteobacteria bacterium]